MCVCVWPGFVCLCVCLGRWTGGGATNCSRARRQVEIIDELYDWREWLEPFNVKVAGLTIMQEGQAVNHAFRFVRRCDLEHYLVKGEYFDWEVQTAEGHQSVASILLCLVARRRS